MIFTITVSLTPNLYFIQVVLTSILVNTGIPDSSIKYSTIRFVVPSLIILSTTRNSYIHKPIKKKKWTNFVYSWFWRIALSFKWSMYHLFLSKMKAKTNILWTHPIIIVLWFWSEFAPRYRNKRAGRSWPFLTIFIFSSQTVLYEYIGKYQNSKT